MTKIQSTGHELDRLFQRMSARGYQTVVDFDERIANALAVLGLTPPVADRDIQQARWRTHASITQDDPYNEQKRIALRVAQEDLLAAAQGGWTATSERAGGSHRPQDAAASRRQSRKASKTAKRQPASRVATTEGQGAHLLADAVSEAKATALAFLTEIRRSSDEFEAKSMAVMKAAYGVYWLGQKHPAELKEWLQLAQVASARGRNAENEFHPIVKSLYPPDAWKEQRKRISEQADALLVAKLSNVEDTAFVRWFGQSEDIDGTGRKVSGFAKARKIVDVSPKRRAARATRREAAERRKRTGTTRSWPARRCTRSRGFRHLRHSNTTGASSCFWLM